MLLLQLERYPEAISILEKVVAESATAANRAALAQAYVLNKDPVKALPAWKEAVAADPESSSLRLRYANALLYNESFAEAAQQYLEALKADANLVEAWNGLAFSLYRVDNYPGALKALLESAALGPEKPGNVYLRAIVGDKLQMHKEAMASYEKFLGMTPGMADEEWKAKERIKVIAKILPPCPMRAIASRTPTRNALACVSTAVSHCSRVMSSGGWKYAGSSGRALLTKMSS